MATSVMVMSFNPKHKIRDQEMNFEVINAVAAQWKNYESDECSQY
jgi:hypothetical protein